MSNNMLGSPRAPCTHARLSVFIAQYHHRNEDDYAKSEEKKNSEIIARLLQLTCVAYMAETFGVEFDASTTYYVIDETAPLRSSLPASLSSHISISEMHGEYSEYRAPSIAPGRRTLECPVSSRRDVDHIMQCWHKSRYRAKIICTLVSDRPDRPVQWWKYAQNVA